MGDLQLSLYAASPDGGRVLGRIAAAFLVVSVLWALAAVFVPVWNPATPLALLGPLPWLGALVAARAGGLCAAYWILVAGLWATLTAYAVFWGGIHSPSLAGYAVLVLVAGALGTSRSAIQAWRAGQTSRPSPSSRVSFTGVVSTRSGSHAFR